MKTIKKTKYEFSSVLASVVAPVGMFALVFFATLVAEGQTATDPAPANKSVGAPGQEIAFPVAELGSCANKNECKDYCSQAEHMDACISFAKNHGLMTEKDATRAEKFTKHVREGSGPGKCNSPQSCDAYCGNLAHLDECTSYAEKNGFTGDQYEHGKKIQAFLKNGGTTPGNCQSKQECQAYCGDFAHAKECFDFAQKAGIAQKEGGNGKNGKPADARHDPNAEQLAKIAELSAKGETPGGCDSKDACKAYCIDQNHHEECLKFAEDHGFAVREDFTQEKAKEGLTHLKRGFENAPPEVQVCLKEKFGDVFEAVRTGKTPMTPELEKSFRTCFQSAHANNGENGAFVKQSGGREMEMCASEHSMQSNKELESILRSAPPLVVLCIKEMFPNGISSTSPAGPEMKNKIRGCFENFKPEHSLQKPMTWTASSTEERREGISHERQQERLQERPLNPFSGGLPNIPPEILGCVREMVGNDVFEKLQTAPPTPELAGAIRTCLEKMRGHQTSPSPFPQNENASQPVTFLEKFIGAALVPLRWILGD